MFKIFFSFQLHKIELSDYKNNEHSMKYQRRMEFDPKKKA